MIGILSKIAAILADHNIPIFAVSTYNTDYLLVKKENYEKAIQALEARRIQDNRVTAQRGESKFSGRINLPP